MAWGVVAQERHVVSCSHMLLLVCVVGRCGAAAHTKPLPHRELPTPATLAMVEGPNENLTRMQNPPKPPPAALADFAKHLRKEIPRHVAGSASLEYSTLCSEFKSPARRASRDTGL